MPRTKIVCTIGPASRSEAVLESMIEAGMNVARLNFSHGTREEHGEVLSRIRTIASRLERPVAVLQDLAGLKVRVGKIEGGSVELRTGESLVLTARPVEGDERRLSISFPGLVDLVEPGDPLLLSDGDIELRVAAVSGDDIRCEVIVGGELGSHKGINLPTRTIDAPALTDKDREDLAFGIDHGVDYVALSFVATAADVRDARRFIAERGGEVPIVAKIERHAAISNLDAILHEVDGIMVARGDLGVETPLSRIPLLQKMLIERANRASMPVITATQMLRSMVESRRPTRAEVTDVANAILDGTDAVMLSEETAVGRYPVEAVQMMSRISEDAETDFPHEEWMRKTVASGGRDVADAVASAACRLAEDIDAAAILACTRSGITARLVSKYRPRRPIGAATVNPEVYRRLALIWGVTPILCERTTTVEDLQAKALQATCSSGLIADGAMVVATGGVPSDGSTVTSLIRVMKASRALESP